MPSTEGTTRQPNNPHSKGRASFLVLFVNEEYKAICFGNSADTKNAERFDFVQPMACTLDTASAEGYKELEDKATEQIKATARDVENNGPGDSSLIDVGLSSLQVVLNRPTKLTRIILDRKNWPDYAQLLEQWNGRDCLLVVAEPVLKPDGRLVITPSERPAELVEAVCWCNCDI